MYATKFKFTPLTIGLTGNMIYLLKSTHLLKDKDRSGYDNRNWLKQQTLKGVRLSIHFQFCPAATSELSSVPFSNQSSPVDRFQGSTQERAA